MEDVYLIIYEFMYFLEFETGVVKWLNGSNIDHSGADGTGSKLCKDKKPHFHF